MEKTIDRKSFFSNLSKVVFSQGLTILSGILVGFIVPKVLGVTGYGYYRIFTMYFTYTALFHFGFIDGVLLRYAGRPYSELNPVRMRVLSRFFFAFQFVVGFAFVVAGVLIRSSDYGFICAMLGLELFVTNLTSYFQFISQATQRFAEFSFRNAAVSGVRIMLSLVLFALYLHNGQYVSYRIYMLALFAVNALMLLWYVKTYRDIIFGKAARFSTEKQTIVSIFKAGVILTVAYQVGHLVFVLDRQFVSLLFSTEVYSVYAFAYSIISLFATMIATISTVLFPMLKTLPKEEALRLFPLLTETISILSGGALLSFYLIRCVVLRFLPEYGNSLGFLRIVFPSLLLTTSISVVGFTYFKILDRIFHYFLFCLSALALGAGLNWAFYRIWGLPEAISWASILTLGLWFLGIRSYFLRVCRISFFKDFAYILCLVGVFYFVQFALDGMLLPAAIYGAVFCAISFVFYRTLLHAFASKTATVLKEKLRSLRSA